MPQKSKAQNSPLNIYDCPCGSGKKLMLCCRNFMHMDNATIAKASTKWPTRLCLITRSWQENGKASVHIVRQDPFNSFFMANYLVDIWCLGIKDAFLVPNAKPHSITNLMNINDVETQLTTIPYENARSIILGSLEYAKSIGFAPHHSWQDTQYAIEPDRPFVKQYTFGYKDGKPLYIAGPYDHERRDIDAIIAHMKKVNGNWVIPID